MKIYDSIILNLVLILFPILLYLICMAYDTNINKRNNILLLDMALISSLYLTLNYSSNLLLMFNIPLIIAYVKKRNFATFLINVMIIRYYYLYSDNYIYYVIYEYLFYALLAYIFNNNSNYLVFSILIIKSIIYIIDSYDLGIALGVSFIFFITTWIVLFMLSKVENIMELHSINKRIKEDEEFRTSLFKITHEIKNPIAVIKGYLDMFDVNNLEHAKKYVPIMQDEVKRLLILLQDFLCMNKIKVNKDILDINLLLEEVVSSLNSVLDEYGIKKEINLYDDEIYIDGDYNRLTQVFVNIIKNSVEARKEYDCYIKIDSYLEDNYVVIKIEDNGTGIPKDVLKRISEPFFTTKKRGTGLGVSLSYEIIEAHNGIISYESIVNEYTLVTIKLPLY